MSAVDAYWKQFDERGKQGGVSLAPLIQVIYVSETAADRFTHRFPSKSSVFQTISTILYHHKFLAQATKEASTKLSTHRQISGIKHTRWLYNRMYFYPRHTNSLW